MTTSQTTAFDPHLRQAQALAYLEEHPLEVDRELIERLTDKQRPSLPLSEFVHGAAARSWRVRLKALREHPRAQELLQRSDHSAPHQPTRVPLGELATLRSGTLKRDRTKATRELTWLKIAHFDQEGGVLYPTDEVATTLEVSEREARSALVPYDLLLLTKGAQFGVYLRPLTSPSATLSKQGELTHTAFISLEASSLHPSIIHPAYLAAYLSSSEGRRALKALQDTKRQAQQETKKEPNKQEPKKTKKTKKTAQEDSQKSLLEWSLSIKDLNQLLIPVPSPWRQAVTISAWLLRTELTRQRALYFDELRAYEAEALSYTGGARSMGGERGERGESSDHDQQRAARYQARLQLLLQPLNSDLPLRELELREAPTFPSLGRFALLRGLTRHLLKLHEREQRLTNAHAAPSWRALNVLVSASPALLKSLRAGSWQTKEQAQLSRAAQLSELNQQCVTLCSLALTQLNRHLLVTDEALGLPKRRPEPWFHFLSEGVEPQLEPWWSQEPQGALETSSLGEAELKSHEPPRSSLLSPAPSQPDMCFLFWGHPSELPPTLGDVIAELNQRALELLSPSEEAPTTSSPRDKSPRELLNPAPHLHLRSLIRLQANLHFERPTLHMHKLGAYAQLRGWTMYVGVYALTPTSSPATSSPATSPPTTSSPTTSSPTTSSPTTSSQERSGGVAQTSPLSQQHQEAPQLYLSSLERLCARVDPPLFSPSLRDLWLRPAHELIEQLSPLMSFHQEHLAELQEQLYTLLGTPR